MPALSSGAGEQFMDAFFKLFWAGAKCLREVEPALKCAFFVNQFYTEVTTEYMRVNTKLI